MELSEIQSQTLEAAKKELRKYPWFRGVCLDYMSTDKEISEDFKGCVDELVCGTMYWDGPTL
jgi:hypothetical protein